MKKKPLVVLTGPTAVGKTKASIGLAKAIGGEIISADSMQVYEYMDIGSAKIRPEEMQGIPHYLVDELKPWDEFHVVRFQQMAKKAMEQIYANGHIPIIVGGMDSISRHYYMTLILPALHRMTIIVKTWKIWQKKKGRNICTICYAKLIQSPLKIFMPII